MTPDPRRARLEELLGIEATQGLSPREANELDTLLAAYPDEDADAMELAAAAVHLALTGSPEPMPSTLAEKLYTRAIAFAPPTTTPKARSSPRSALLTWTGWIVAASLLVALVYTNWPTPTDKQKPVPTLAEKRDDLKKRAPEYIGEKNRVSGSIVWSDKEQVGFLEVKGLPPIDATAGTYQLWIVDGDRKGSPPIDGGVFKVNPDGTALVEIRTPIKVKNAAAFAITRETEPDGVVVSLVNPENYEVVFMPKKG